MTDPRGLNRDFREFIEALNRHGVESEAVGGFALATHGAPGATGGMDLFVRATTKNAERVDSALAEFGAPLKSAGVVGADFARPGVVYQVGLPPRRIDVLTAISGVSFEQTWRSRIKHTIDDVRVTFIARAPLIGNKRAAGRPKDLADVERLDARTRRPRKPR